MDKSQSLIDLKRIKVIKGASHVAFLEESYYHVFQDRLISFLGSTEAADKEDNEETDKAA